MINTIENARRLASAAIFILVATCAFQFSGGLLAGQSQPMEIRLGSGEKSVERYREYNYNAAILGDLRQLASFDAAFLGAIAKGSVLRERIEQQRQKFQKACERAGKLGRSEERRGGKEGR